MQVKVHPEDWDVFTTLDCAGLEGEPYDEAWVDLDEMNYGGADLLREALAANVRLVGKHDAGGDYGAYAFYIAPNSEGTLEHYEAPTDGDAVVVRVPWKNAGPIDPDFRSNAGHAFAFVDDYKAMEAEIDKAVAHLGGN